MDKEVYFRYGFSFYKANELAYFAEKYSEYIRLVFPKTTHILCSSSSGMSIASAIAIYSFNKYNIDYDLIYIKSTEHTFRDSSCELNGKPAKNANYVIVDDLIDSGATISHLVDIAIRQGIPQIDGIVVWKTVGNITKYIRNIKVYTLQ